MAISRAFTLGPIDLDTKTLGVGGALLGGIRDMTPALGLNPIVEGSDGEVYARFVAIMSQRPTVRFSTTEIKAALDKCGLSGMIIDNDVTYKGLVFYLQQLAEGGVRSGAGANMKITVPEGILVPRTLSVDQDGAAILAYEALATWDGTNDPFVLAVDQDMPAGTPGVANLWTVGPVKINGTALDSVMGLNIDFGLDARAEASDGEVWPRFPYIHGVRAVATFRTRDVELLNTLGITGDAQGETDSVIYLRKLKEGGGRELDATEVHISLTVDEGLIAVTELGAAHDGQAEATVTLWATYDGSNAPFVIDTTAAIV